jgi:hypothetical protein
MALQLLLVRAIALVESQALWCPLLFIMLLQTPRGMGSSIYLYFSVGRPTHEKMKW